MKIFTLKFCSFLIVALMFSSCASTHFFQKHIPNALSLEKYIPKYNSTYPQTSIQKIYIHGVYDQREQPSVYGAYFDKNLGYFQLRSNTNIQAWFYDALISELSSHGYEFVNNAYDATIKLELSFLDISLKFHDNLYRGNFKNNVTVNLSLQNKAKRELKTLSSDFVQHLEDVPFIDQYNHALYFMLSELVKEVAKEVRSF